MSYHFSHSFKEPQTKKEKLRAARQCFITALIFGAVTIALAGWSYLHLKKQAERSKALAESSKKNEELFRELARSQGAKPKPSPADEPPATKSGGSFNATPYVAPIVSAVVSLLMFCLGISYTAKAREMPETPENRERERGI